MLKTLACCRSFVPLVHLKAKAGTPLSNVMLRLLHSLGLDDLNSFGDSQGTFAWG